MGSLSGLVAQVRSMFWKQRSGKKKWFLDTLQDTSEFCSWYLSSAALKCSQNVAHVPDWANQPISCSTASFICSIRAIPMFFMEWLCSDQPWLHSGAIICSRRCYGICKHIHGNAQKKKRVISNVSYSSPLIRGHGHGRVIAGGKWCTDIICQQNRLSQTGTWSTIKPKMEQSAYMIKSLARWLHAILASLQHFQH